MIIRRNFRSSKAYLTNQEQQLKQKPQRTVDGLCYDFPDCNDRFLIF